MGTIIEKVNEIKKTKNKLKEIINIGGGQITDDTIFNDYVNEIKDIYIDAISNGIDNIYNNFPKVTGEGSEITLNTEKGPLKIILEGNTSQDGTPTPDRPIPIKVVTGEQSIEIKNSDSTLSQTYPLSLGNIELCKIGTYQDYIRKSTGKNLLSSELETGGISEKTGQNSNAGRTRTKDYIDIQPNTEYTLSADYQGWYIVYYYNESQTFISSLANNSNKITFTTPSNAKYLRCVVAITNAQNVMLNTGQTTLPYEPYGTSWYLNKQIGKVVLDGSENWDNDAGTLGTSYRHNISVSNLGIATPILPQQPNLSDYFKYNYSNIGDFGNFYLESGWLVFTDKNQVYTLANFKTWLSTHNTNVYYVLATPTNTKITDTTLISQLENINNNARSYKDTTIIECSSLIDDNETIQVLAIALKNIN